MYGTNIALLQGALTRTPELIIRGQGLQVVEFTIAGSVPQHGRDVTYYINTSVVDKTAARFMEGQPQAGDIVMAKGQAQYQTWEANGVRRKTVKFQTQMIDRASGDFRALLLNDSAGGMRLVGGVNTILFGGNVTSDPELRYTPAGDAVMDVDIACNQRYNRPDGQSGERVDYVTVTLWRELAEAHQHLRKGASVSVTGVMITDSWEDKTTKDKRSTLKIQATTFTELAPFASAARSVPREQREPVASASQARSGPAAKASTPLDPMGDFPPEEDLPF